MDSESKKPIQVAALGRPFALGMLYDCREDLLIPGLNLWDHRDLEKHIGERPQTYNNFGIVASESIEDKSSALDVEASLKASLFGGLVEVGGSAKYLDNRRTSKNQARVTLKYQTTTKVKELSMDHLGRRNVKHPEVFEKGIATHVVTAVLYGAQAFFVFDREVSQQENHQDIEGNLEAMIKKIPFFAVEGEGSLKIEDKDKSNVDKFSCSFFGDFNLQKMPTSYQDAIQVYQSLPQQLGTNGENAVPMKVWLLPLTTLDSSAAKLVRQISVSLVQESQRALEDLNELEMRCNDALKTTTAKQFPQIGQKIKTFKEMCSEFKLDFQKKLAKKLPSIRGGGEEEAVLAEILKKRHSSPFSSKNLNEWMDCKEKEIWFLTSITNLMKNTKVVSAQRVNEEIFSAEHSLCYVFTSLGDDEPFLSDLSNYLRQTPEKENPQDAHTYDVEKEQWYTSKEVAKLMRTQAKLFSDFAEANLEKDNIKFLTVGITNKNLKGSSICLYEYDYPVSENFEPPSRPKAVTVGDVGHNSVTLKIDPPQFGSENITSYSVEFCVRGEEQWKQQETSKPEEVTVGDLSPDTEYMFRCRAVTSVGVGPANQVNRPVKTLAWTPPGKLQVGSDSSEISVSWERPAVSVGPANQVSRPVKTLAWTPPGKLQVESDSSEISVSWERPAEIGGDVSDLSYIVEYAKTDDKADTEEDLKWSQKMTKTERAVISGLQQLTEYAVRVRCDCGAAGRSKESITEKICTTKEMPLKELVKTRSKRLNSASPSVYKVPLKKLSMNIPGCRRFSFGKENMKQNCTIMLMGATGSGKSTLINGMINYILGVNWEDDFRFKLIEEEESRSQSESQTSEVTVYKINHQEGFRVPFSLTIVDTPGFGDTRGIKRDREITEQLRNLFFSKAGVGEIDAVCFVAQSALARLSPAQRYVFDSVLSIFGRDIAENIRILVTFADGQLPPVLEAIKAADVPCPKTEDGLPVHFKFNNSAVFAENKTSAADSKSGRKARNFDEMFWDMGEGSMEMFFDALELMDTKSLTLTQEVLRERKQLGISIEKLQEQVKVGLAKLEEIKETAEKLKQYEAEINRNKDFEFPVTVQKPVKEDISGSGRFVTNCHQCNYTCHNHCAYANDADKIKCSAMGKDGYCTVCPGKCIWSVHTNMTYRWVFKDVTETKTVSELKQKYDIAMEAKSPVEALIRKLKADYDYVQAEVEELMVQSTKCLNRLRKIALRPDPLSTTEYIDMLIEAEKSEGKPGWKNRVESLMDMREHAIYMDKVNKGEKLLQQGFNKKTSNAEKFFSSLLELGINFFDHFKRKKNSHGHDY